MPQEYSLARLADELEELRLDHFDYDFAWELGSRMRARARQANSPVAVQVAHGTDLAFSALLPGSTADNLDWAARKQAVANRFHRSSLAMKLEAQEGEYDFARRYRLPDTDYAASGGGFPLMMKHGTLIGTAGVSGLPDVEDHLLIVTTLRELLAAGA